MGQQRYEKEIVLRAPAALGDGWRVEARMVRSLRSGLPGNRRIPVGLVSSPRASASLRTLAGRWLGRHATVVHRMDLRLPPIPDEVLTVHDLAPLRVSDEGSLPATAAAEARRARRVVCPSAFAAGEVSHLFGVEGPVVIHNGVEEAFFDAKPALRADLEVLGIGARFVLHVGGCSQRKNLPALAQAWFNLAPAYRDVSIVLIGPPHPDRDRLFGPLPRALRLGRVGFETLTSLMAAAAVVVVPSTYEGFGIPALEAMAVGTPVVASNRSSIPEVCGDAGLLVEPNPDGLAEGLHAALKGGSWIDAMVARGRVRARTFTWENSALAHAEVWRSVA